MSLYFEDMEVGQKFVKGELARSNAQLVERAVRIARELEIEVASLDEAKEMLGLMRKSA